MQSEDEYDHLTTATWTKPLATLGQRAAVARLHRGPHLGHHGVQVGEVAQPQLRKYVMSCQVMSCLTLEKIRVPLMCTSNSFLPKGGMMVTKII